MSTNVPKDSTELGILITEVKNLKEISKTLEKTNENFQEIQKTILKQDFEIERLKSSQTLQQNTLTYIQDIELKNIKDNMVQKSTFRNVFSIIGSLLVVLGTAAGGLAVFLKDSPSPFQSEVIESQKEQINNLRNSIQELIEKKSN